MSSKTIHDNGNIELTLTISWSEVSAEYEKVVDEAVASVEIEGFRKGKAPKELVVPKLDKTKLYSKSIERLLPKTYSAAVTSAQIKPIVQPVISLESGDENQDWIFKAITCEAPTLTLPDKWLDEVKKLPKPDKDSDKLVPIVNWLKQHTEIAVPDILSEEETNHRLSALAENITRLGLSMDSYLKSRKMTSDMLRSQTKESAVEDLKVEFILEQVSATQNLKTRKDTLDFLQSLL